MYRRIDYLDRIDLEFYLSQGLNQKQIARRMGFNESTISREIRRNELPSQYQAGHAQRLTWQRWHRRKPKKMDEKLKTQIIKLLKLFWSPEQISHRLRIEGSKTVSPETIYRFIDRDRKRGGDLYLNLRRVRKRRKRRFPSRVPSRQEKLPCIENREQEANDRIRIGDWERDTMFGTSRKECLLVIVDRKTKYTKLAKLKSKKPDEANQKTIELLKGLPKKTITSDRGFEFLKFQSLKEKTRAKIYFCHPYTSSERGTNENTIGLIRQYIPKKVSLDRFTNKEIRRIEDKINSRPRKTLDWRTPNEVFYRDRNCNA
jgi:IS30 family transposase